LIDVNKSTVSREIEKNSNMHRHYVAIEAQQFSEMRKAVPRRPRKLSKADWQDIEQCLKRHWSPETIVGARKREGKTCVPIEWIYHIIRRDKKTWRNPLHLPAASPQTPQKARKFAYPHQGQSEH
jgi:IS30 family transposase